MKTPPAKGRWRRRLLAPPALGLLVAGVLGLLLRYTVKDRLPILAAAFYGLPSLVVVLALVTSFGMYLFLRWRRRAIASGILAILAIAAWVQTDVIRGTAPDRTEAQLRIVLWTACPLIDPNDGGLSLLQGTDAQIILMAESGASTDYHKQNWQSHFPDYHICMLGHGLTFMSRYPFSNPRLVEMGRRTLITAYDLDTPFGPLTVLGVDIESNPFAWRKPFMDRIHAIATAPSHPVIIMGDFNTPHTSAHLDGLRRSFQHAIEEGTTGLVTTWPYLCPVLALDYIWLSEHFVPVRTTVRRTLHSEHALVIADVSLDMTQKPHAQQARSTDE